MASSVVIQGLNEDSCDQLLASTSISSFSHAIEEVIMNSIDAGSNKIEITFSLSTLSFTVLDNGHGILKQDLCERLGEWSQSSKTLASTSNSTPFSYGCKGKAVAALRYLSSSLQITTRSPESRTVYSKIFHHGRLHIIKQETTSAIMNKIRPHGTMITMKHLFITYPVRQLHYQRLSERYLIKDFVKKMSILHHHISWKLIDEESHKVLLHLPSQLSVAKRIISLHGLGMMVRMKPLSYQDVEDRRGRIGWKLEGLLSLPTASHCHWNHDFQYAYLNHRWLRGKDLLSQVINEIFTKLLASERHGGPRPKHSSVLQEEKQSCPVFALVLTLHDNDFDILVEPDKTRPILKDELAVRRFLGRALKAFFQKENFFEAAAVVDMVIMNEIISSSNTISGDMITSQQVVQVVDQDKEEEVVQEEKEKKSLLFEIAPLQPTYYPAATSASSASSSLLMNHQLGYDELGNVFHAAFDINSSSLSDDMNDKVKSKEICLESIAKGVAVQSGTQHEPTYPIMPTDDFILKEGQEGECLREHPSDVLWGQLVNEDENSMSRAYFVNTAEDGHGNDEERRSPQSVNLFDAYIFEPPKVPPSSSNSSTSGIIPSHNGNDSGDISMRRKDESDSQPGNRKRRKQLTLSSKVKLNDQDGSLFLKKEVPMSLSKDQITTLRFIGQVDRKYLATFDPQNKVVIFFDQHAVDERIRLEQSKPQLSMSQGQWKDIVSITPPEKVMIDEEDAIILSAHEATLAKWGFSFTVNHPATSSHFRHRRQQRLSLLLRTMPQVLGEKLTSSDLFEFGRYLHQYGQHHLADDRVRPPAFHRIAASKACRGAITFNTTLSSEVCEKLLTRLSSTELPFLCAHGRPSAVPLVEMSKLASFQISTSSLCSQEKVRLMAKQAKTNGLNKVTLTS